MNCWRINLFVGIAVLISVVGCDKPQGPVCAPVSGSLRYKGKPLAEAMVVLHRIGGDVEGHQKPMAYTDTNGEFVLTTFSDNDGAPPGEYAITVELRAPEMVGEEVMRNGPNLLPARYSKPEKSGLKTTVVDGDNVIQPIEIAER